MPRAPPERPPSGTSPRSPQSPQTPAPAPSCPRWGRGGRGARGEGFSGAGVPRAAAKHLASGPKRRLPSRQLPELPPRGPRSSERRAPSPPPRVTARLRVVPEAGHAGRCGAGDQTRGHAERLPRRGGGDPGRWKGEPRTPPPGGPGLGRGRPALPPARAAPGRSLGHARGRLGRARRGAEADTDRASPKRSRRACVRAASAQSPRAGRGEGQWLRGTGARGGGRGRRGGTAGGGWGATGVRLSGRGRAPGRGARPGQAAGAAGRGWGCAGGDCATKACASLPPSPPPSRLLLRPPLPAPPPAAAGPREPAERAEQGRGRAPEYADERVTDSSAFQCPSETRALLPQLLTPDSRLPQTPTAGLARGCAHRLRAAAAAAPPPRRSPGPRASPASARAGPPRPAAPAPAAAPRPGRAWMEGAARPARCSA
ncbi:translation initiation factor IF-2-like [Hyaena hyaena]|uniref:translation initiation factor IF-2-like n=1 Tax=Hyaena hyaena TaxID=95912 RepID=UPI001921F948|nr:translation initiation factor IF-2-like [Hyaena hyaena]